MKVVTSDEMQQIDNSAITQKRIPALLLMESAGRISAGFIEKKFPLAQKIVLIAGTGNNGGDGFVLARYLTNIGKTVSIYIAGDESKIKENPKINLNILKSLGLVPSFFSNFNSIKDSLSERLSSADLLVDAMLGIGLKDEVRGFRKETIEFLNGLDIIKLALDIPSGIVCDDLNKNRSLCCLKVNYTLTMGLPKTGMIYSEGANCSGKIFVLDIGFSHDLINSYNFKREFMDCEYAKLNLPIRNRFVHKGNQGTVTIVAGSEDYLGASILTGYGALMGGSGLVKQVIPNISGVLPSQNHPDIIYHILKDKSEGYFVNNNIPALIKTVEFSKTVVIGPGLGRHKETTEFVIKLVEFLLKENRQLIIDADGLFHLSSNLDILQKSSKPVILTPHIGEFSRLSAISIEEIKLNREQIAKDFSQKHDVILLLKDAITTIFHPDGRVAFSDSGHPGMAKGGMGDLLAGLVASLVGQGVKPFTASATAAYVHGIAGSMMVAAKGETGVLASKMSEYIAAAIFQIKSKHLETVHLSNEPISINYLGRYFDG